MQSISSANNGSRRQYSLLFRLLGRQLNEPSFTAVTYSVLLILDLVLLALYPIIQHFTSLTALTLSATSADLQNKASLGVMLIIIIPCCLLFVTLVVILLIVNFYISNRHQQQDSLSSKFIQRFLNRISVLFRTILFMPLLHLLITSFKLNLSDKIPQPVVTALGVFGVVEFFILFVLFCILTESSNPYSHHYWGSEAPFATLLKCIIKSLFVILVQYGSVETVKILAAIECATCVGWILNCIFLYQGYYYYHKVIERTSVGVCFWIGLQVLISSSNPTKSPLVDSIFMISGIVLSVASLNYLFTVFEQRNQQKLESATKQMAIVSGVISSISLIDKGDYYKLFSKHLLHCKNPGCACKNILSKMNSQQQVIDADFYLYLEQVILEKISLVEEKKRLKRLLSYIYLVKLKMKNSSITLLNALKVQYQEANFIKKFKIECLEGVITHYIYELSEKNNSQLQIEKCYLAQKKYTEFRFTIFKACNNIIDFWKILNVKDYNMEGLYNLNKNMITDSKYITSLFTKLHSTSPNNKEIIVEYMEFREKFLSEDVSECKGMLQDLKKVVDGEGKYLDPIAAMFLNSGHPGIIVVSANQSNFNNIHYANSYFLIKTVYYERDVVGQSLDMFIPSPFIDTHTQHMKAYLNAKQAEATKSNIRIQIFASNKNILLGTMTVSLLNDVSEGLLFIGIINFEECTQRLLFVSDRGLIYGMNQQFVNDYGKVLQDNIKDVLPGLNMSSLTEGKVQDFKLISVTEVAQEYEMVESDPMTYSVRVQIKEERKVDDKSCFILSVQSEDRQLTTIINQQNTIGLDDSDISEINLEEDNNELQIEAVNAMFEQVMFKERKPIRLLLSKLIGLITSLVFIVITIFNAYHFIDQVDLMIQQYNSALSLSKTNLRIVDTSLLARRLNVQAFFLQNNDTTMYKYYESYYNVSILKMNSVYYQTNSQILYLKSRGFDDSNADLSVTSWSYPSSREETQLYNILTMYIQSVTYLDTATMAQMTFQPLRIYNDSFTMYKSEMEDVIINTYASILPKLDVITPAVNDFWKGQIHKDDNVWYIILIFVIVYSIALTVAIIMIDRYYVTKYQNTVNITLDFSKNDLNMYISNVENYQYKMYPEYYQTNWMNALLYLFEDNDPTKKMKGTTETTNHNISQVSNILTPMEEDTRLRKRSKNKSSKQVSLEDEKKAPCDLKLRYRSVRHLVSYFIFILIIMAYFISDFGLVRTYMNKLVLTTSQLSQILERMKLISSMRFVTQDSLFELSPWPTNKSLAQQAKQYSNQLFFNQQKLQSAEVTYPEWTNEIFWLNKVNICEHYELYGANNDYYPTKDDCLKTAGGILTKGFNLALSTFSNMAQTIYMLSNPNMSNPFLQGITKSGVLQDFNNLTEYLLSSSKYLRNLYLKIMVNKYSSYGDSFKLKGFLFSAVLILMLILWNYIIDKMSSVAEETKGLLKLITLHKIQKTEKIKKALMAQGIIQSLK